MRILLIEDDPVVAQSIALMLSRAIRGGQRLSARAASILAGSNDTI
jgi:hypothetical protein